MRKAIVHLEDDHARNSERAAHGVDDVVLHFRAERRPRFEIESLELAIDRSRGALIKKHERAANVGDVHRLPVPIQYKDAALQDGQNDLLLNRSWLL